MRGRLACWEESARTPSPSAPLDRVTFCLKAFCLSVLLLGTFPRVLICYQVLFDLIRIARLTFISN